MAVDPKTLKAFAGKKPKTPPPAPDPEVEPDGDEPVEEEAATDGVENTGENAGDGDVSTDEQLAQDVMGKVVGGDVDEELVDLVGQQDAVDGTFPWVKSPDIWDRAMKSLDPDDVPQGTDPFVVLAHVYMAMGGEVDGLSGAPEGGDVNEEEPDGDEGAPPPAGGPPPAPPAPGPPKAK